MLQQIKVASSSNVSNVAGAISNIMRNQSYLEVGLFSVSSYRKVLTPSGIEIYVMPSFKEISIDGKEKTAIKLRIEKK